MFKRLRVRFIALSMASLLLVLGVILGAVNLISYRHVVQEADGILDILAENGGSFPKPDGGEPIENTETPAFPTEPGQPGVLPPGEAQPLPTPGEAAPEQPAEDGGLPWYRPGEIPVPATPPDGETNPVVTPELVWNSTPAGRDLTEILQPLAAGTEDTDASGEADPGARRDRESVRSKEMPYESRYFTVTVNSAGDVLSVDTGKVAAVDMEQAVAYAEAALASGKTRGFADDYRYLVSDTDDGQLVLFLDCGRNLTTWRSFLIASLGVAAGGLAAVFLLILAFSGRVVRPVAESYEKQKRFITDAGHEIKTPLAIIEADAEVLEMELDGESEWLQDIRAQTRRLADLTNDLVYLSRMEERQDSAQLVDFPLSDVVEETAQSFRSRAMQKRQTFTERIEPMLTLRGDEKAVRQLTGILLDNAVKYAPEGGVIELTLARQGRGAALTVFNTTETAIPRESLDRLFDRFYRTDPSRSSATGGHGIGLSIARAIVNAHRGKITAESADGHSLRITAWFPL